MDLREMEYFTVIAQECNLTRASEKLFVSQPALSKYLQRLESQLGVQLFQHIGKRLRLTFAGERYLHYAREILRISNELESEMADIRRQDVGRLRVGMPPYRFSFVMPEVLPRFRKLHENVEVELFEEASAQLDAMLLAGDIDLAVYNLSERDPRLHYEVLRTDDIFAVLPSGHPLREKALPAEDGGEPLLTLEDLKDETFILQNRSQRLGQFIMRELHEKQITPHRILESSNIRAAAMLAASGYGVSFLSGDLLRHFEAAYRCDCYRLSGCSLPMEVVAATRSGSYLPGCVRDFIDLVRKA